MKPICTCQPERPSLRLRKLKAKWASDAVERRLAAVIDWRWKPWSYDRWFAWRPVRIAGKWVWWRYVERRMRGCPATAMVGMGTLFHDYRELQT